MHNNTTDQIYYPPVPLQSDMLWLRLSILSSGPQRLAYLEKALQANPYNKQTLRLIERIDPERAQEARMWIDVLSEIIDSARTDATHPHP